MNDLITLINRQRAIECLNGSEAPFCAGVVAGTLRAAAALLTPGEYNTLLDACDLGPMEVDNYLWRTNEPNSPIQILDV